MAVEASSSIGSDIFAFVSLLVIALLVLVVIRHYLPLRSTPSYLLVPVFLALALPCSIILLVPIDLVSAVGDETSHGRGVWLPDRLILVTWRITYWLTFMLTWFILPFLGEYCDSGYRDAHNRTLYSLRTNARYNLIMLGTGIVGMVYFIMENGFHAETIKGLIMALAYAWGLFLAIGLMGHGLVAVPRRLFKNASVSTRLRRLQMQAPKAKEKLDEATSLLEDLEHTVVQLKRTKNGASKEQQDWIDELADTSTVDGPRRGIAAALQASNTSIPAVVTDRYLAELTRKLKRARHRKARFVEEWSNLCQSARDTQTILDSASSKKLEFGPKWAGDGYSIIPFTVLTPSMRYHVHMQILPALRIALSVVLAVASVMIVWSEFVNPFAQKLSVIGLSIVHHPNSDSNDKVNFGGQILAAAWLLYMDTCALYAITDVKVWGNRALVKRKTYAESACWYSLQVAKLTVPLSFNFVTLMPESVYKDTSFYQFFGQLIDLTPLGEGFSAFFPCVLLIPALATLFNLYGKAKGILGFGVLEDDSEENPSGFGTGGWREGKALIEHELQTRGAEGTTVGLAERGESLDLERGPARNDPPVSSSTSAYRSQRLPESRAPLLDPDSDIQTANRQFNTVTNQEESNDGPRNFYQDFTERVRNTLDSAERPEWVSKIGSGFKVPRWMQNDQRDGNGSSPLSRWFGGRPDDGRVRL